jgi:mono/diheme cytochrome c family protein
MKSMRVEFEGAGIKRQALEYALASPEKKPGEKPPFAVDPELASRGQQLFSSLGCASCHQLQVDGKRLESARSAKPFASLNLTGGCLSPEPTNTPHYSLTEHQRASLKNAIQFLGIEANADIVFSPENQLASALAAFNCYACHQRGERGGVEQVRNPWFQSDQPEMGDEGRIPPHLNGVGAKLQPEWIKQVFDNGAKDRPYMFTRMPRFGSQNIGYLVAAFGLADPDVADHGATTAVDERHILAAGRKLVGSEGFSCIKCHTWGNVKATGIQSINMVTMTRRLKENWFHQYMLNPQQYRPGTRMPAAWPQGQVLLPTVLDGKALTQIHSVWEYLSDGDKATMPVGLGSNPIILTAFDEAIIYRNFIEGAGPRAIGVGYPEKLNQAFDANNLRIALLWHGAFMDASKHWLGRGSGFQAPLGDNLLRLPHGVSFSVLDSPDTLWPTQTAKELGYAFRGYRLGEAQRPTFLYRVGNASIEDTLVATSTAQFTPARRTITVTADSAVANLWYRAASGEKIVPLDGGWYSVDGRWKTRIADVTLRESNGKSELLVPLGLEDGKASIVQDYAW